MPDAPDNLESLSIEQLDAIMRGETSEAEAPATPEPVEAPPIETPAVEQPEPTPAPASEAEPVKAETPEPDINEQILQAKLEEMDAKVKHWQQIAGKNGGELGFLRNRIEQLQASLEARRAGDDGTGYEPEPVAHPAAPSRDSLREWAVRTATNQALQSFIAANPDVMEMQAEMQSYLKATEYVPPQFDDPVAASKEAERALNEAYFYARSERKARIVSELQTKKADQMRGLAQAKANAAISASGSTPPPRAQPKTYDQMSVDELDAELRRLSGERPRRT